MEDSVTWLHTSISIIGWHMYNKHIMHKAFLACIIIGSTPSVLGHLLCPSQHSPLPCIRGFPLHRQSQADKNIMGYATMSADLIIDVKMVKWYVFWIITSLRMMQLSHGKGAWFMYRSRSMLSSWLWGKFAHGGCQWTRFISIILDVYFLNPFLMRSRIFDIAESRQYNYSEWIFLPGEVRVSLIV